MYYQGSKLSLLDFIHETITEVANPTPTTHTFTDLFAGTGIVGATYRSNGYTVISNDMQYYSYVRLKHYIENTQEQLDYSLFTHLNNLEGVEGFVYNNYCQNENSSRNYYLAENGLQCDAIRQEIERLYQCKEINEPTYYFLLASLITSIDKYANTTSAYASYLKHLKDSAQKRLILEPLPLKQGPVGKVYNQDCNKLIRNIKGDILYLDPPYTTKQYATAYHVLETIAKYDNPTLQGVTGVRTDCMNQKSDYCSRRTALKTLEDLISNANFKYIFLSYNNEGIMTTNEIKNLLSRYGTYGYKMQWYKRYNSQTPSTDELSIDTTIEYIHYMVR